MATLARSSGLSLIELLVALAVLAILALVGYPLYTEQVQKARRYDAQGVLMMLANEAEQHRAGQPNVGYTGFETRVNTDGEFDSLWDGIADSYTFSVTPSTTSAFGYTLSATPIGGQTTDRCGALTLNQLGEQGSADTNCWK